MWLTVRKGTQFNGWGSRDRELWKHTGATVCHSCLVRWLLVKNRPWNGDGLRVKQSVFSASQQPDPVSYLHGVREQIWMSWGVLLAGCAESWECWVMKESLARSLELLSAGKVMFWVIQTLSMSHSPIITLSSNRCCRRLVAPLFWLIPVNMTFSREVSVTLRLIKC